VRPRDNESVQQMYRRLKKLCEKEGLTKEIKRKSYYEKPSERKRRALRKAKRRLVKMLEEPKKKPARFGPGGPGGGRFGSGGGFGGGGGYGGGFGGGGRGPMA